MSIESAMPSNHLILRYPLLLQPSIFPSFRIFSNESVLRIRWPKYWSFSFCISPPNEHLGLISFRMDWISLQPRDSQESFPTPQFKSSNSSALSFLYSPTLTSTPTWIKRLARRKIKLSFYYVPCCYILVGSFIFFFYLFSKYYHVFHWPNIT